VFTGKESKEAMDQLFPKAKVLHYVVGFLFICLIWVCLFFFCFPVLGFELRALCLLVRHSTISAMPPTQVL
jgi:hypothetical protein